MDQNTRTKVLAGTLAVVLGFGFIRPDQKIMQPIRDAEAARQKAETNLQKADDKNTAVMQAEVDVERAQAVSLPPSPTDAMRVYQKWITNLAEQCRFSALNVSPGRPDVKEDSFLTVSVQVEGEVGLEDFSRFMFLFDQANLKHRITNLEIESSGTSGTPRMDVVFTAEGMSVAGSPDHDDVFPLTSLQSELTADATEIAVESIADFPKKTPFLAQVGREMVEVTEASETKWTVTRGVQGTKAMSHNAKDYVQLFPIRYQEQPASFDDYQNFLAASPFIKPIVPRALSPKIAGLSDQTIEPGDSVSLKVSTVDVVADVGAITLELVDAADGMTLDSETGEFKWETTAETEAKTYSPKIVVRQKNNEELKLEKSFNVTLRLPNDAPKLVVPSEAVVVLGQSFELGLSAEDDGDLSALSFSLEGSVPEGLSLDGSTKQLKWIPAKSFTPGEYDVTVKVTDSGQPAKSATESVKLKVQDDAAVYLKLTGCVTLDNKSEAMFRNLISTDSPVLKVGDKLEASEISSRVTEISSRYVLIEDAEGIWRIDLGTTLRDRKLVKAAEKPAEESPAETDAGDSKEEAVTETAETEVPAKDAPAEEATATEAAAKDGQVSETSATEPVKSEADSPAVDSSPSATVKEEVTEEAGTAEKIPKAKL